MTHTLQRETSNIKEKVTKGLNPKPKRNQFLISLHKALQVTLRFFILTITNSKL